MGFGDSAEDEVEIEVGRWRWRNVVGFGGLGRGIVYIERADMQVHGAGRAGLRRASSNGFTSRSSLASIDEEV